MDMKFKIFSSKEEEILHFSRTELTQLECLYSCQDQESRYCLLTGLPQYISRARARESISDHPRDSRSYHCENCNIIGLCL